MTLSHSKALTQGPSFIPDPSHKERKRGQDTEVVEMRERLRERERGGGGGGGGGGEDRRGREGGGRRREEQEKGK